MRLWTTSTEIKSPDQSRPDATGRKTQRGRYFPVLHAPEDMSTYTVRGSFPARDGPQQFEKEVEAPNEDVATERVYSNFGSQQNLKRTQITIDEVAA